jgi:alkylation response protein AidB-like acyl-CoA dehydrogenase
MPEPDLSDSESDLEALRSGIRDVLEREAARDQVQSFVAGGLTLDAGLWTKASELGWLALAIPEEYGGLGLDFAAQAILYEELGRFVTPLPLLGTMLVAEALAGSGTPKQQAAWLPRIASGEMPASLPVQTPGGPADGVLMSKAGDRLILSGRADDLIEGAAARLLLIGARDADGGQHYILVEPAADGVAAVAEPTADQTRHLAHIRFENTAIPADRLLPGPAEALNEALLSHAALALACDAMGGAAAIFEQTIDYLKIREQFGKPIGSFQALKHRCADHKVALEASGAVVREAVRKRAAGATDAALYASMAKFYACDVYSTIATDAVQLHGGIGFTWEHPCHLFLKRAKLNEALFGTAAAHADRAANLLLAA